MTDEKINSVLEIYLPDDYYEDLRGKILPHIRNLIISETMQKGARISELEDALRKAEDLLTKTGSEGEQWNHEMLFLAEIDRVLK